MLNVGRRRALVSIAGVVMLVLLGFGPDEGQLRAGAPIQWQTDFNKALASAQGLDRPVMLDFFASWCGYCRRLRKETYPSAEVTDEASKFVSVTINSEEQPSLARKYRVSGVPVIVFLDKNGSVLDRVDGFVDARTLARKMRDVAKRRAGAGVLVQQLEKDPGNVSLNFKVGLYYFENGNAARARDHFLRAYSSSAPGAAEDRQNALYNAAVASMELKDYRSAAGYWNTYLMRFTAVDNNHAYARYFRGLCLRELGQVKEARADLQYASLSLHDPEDKMGAEEALKGLGQ
ncbi:MAG: thioredoxin fold domain-containing protein [Spirochaetia bacterium]|nr:thioredoxin fold domain-containing protein [Spirochaetia bacterium]